MATRLALSWTSYNGSAATDVAKFKEAFSIADEFLRFISSIYRLTIPIPQIKIFEGSAFEAFAEDSYDILLSSGVVKYTLQVYDEMFSGELPEGTEKPNPIVLTITTLLFVVAHEFFHIARGHFKILRERPNCHHALEYDADGMAATALYRWNQYRFNRTQMTPAQRAQVSALTPSDFKGVILYSVFWPIRAQIGSTIAATNWSPTHPCWHVRLWAIVRKLAFVDNVSLIDGKPIESSQVQFDVNVGMDLLLSAEQHYLARKNIPPEKSTVEAFFYTDFEKEYFVPVHRKFVEIRELIRKHSYLEALRHGPM